MHGRDMRWKYVVSSVISDIMHIIGGMNMCTVVAKLLLENNTVWFQKISILIQWRVVGNFVHFLLLTNANETFGTNNYKEQKQKISV